MDRDFIYRQTLVWLEMEEMVPVLGIRLATNSGAAKERERLAESLTNHLTNNFEQIQRAKANVHKCQGLYCSHH